MPTLTSNMLAELSTGRTQHMNNPSYENRFSGSRVPDGSLEITQQVSVCEPPICFSVLSVDLFRGDEALVCFHENSQLQAYSWDP